MKELLFVDLDEVQQYQAKRRFLTASPGDGYWYLITKDGHLLSRNRVKNGESIKWKKASDLFQEMLHDS